MMGSVRPTCAFGAAALLVCLMGFATFPFVAPAFSIEACFRAQERERTHRHPQYLTTTPPKALSSILAVLRRRATRFDRIPAATFRQVEPSEYKALWPHATRLLGIGPDGTHYYLVVGFRSPPGVPSACVQHPGEHPRVTGPDGTVATVVWDATLPGGGTDSGTSPRTPVWINDGIGSFYEPTEPGTPLALFFTVVPDGVARVTVTVGAHPPTEMTVANNFAISKIPAPQDGESIGQRWYAADGTLLKTITQQRGPTLTTG